MADTITTTSGAQFEVYYEADNRQKRIEWTSGTATVNDLYSTLQDHFDALAQMDDGTPMSAQTPTAYTIGIIDTGSDDPWFIDDTTVENLTGGAITTASWARSPLVGDGTGNTGIVKIIVTDVNLAVGDIGSTITHTDGQSGTIVHAIINGASTELWIRPDSNAQADDFDSTSGTYTVTGSSNTCTATAGSGQASGESLWSNIFTIGTISDNTHIYVEQNNALLTASEATTDWWADGQIDILVKVKAEDTEIDEAVITVFARQLTQSYSHFETDLTNGGATAIPLGTGNDLNISQGVREMIITTGATAEPVVGEVLQVSGDDTTQGVITSVVGTNPNVTLQYYLIGDPLDDFIASDSLVGNTSGFTGTAVAPSDVNAGALAGISIAYTNNSTLDVDENDTNENYSVVFDASDETLQDLYEWAQYITRRGNSTTTDTDGQQGQFYRGIDYVLFYGTDTVTGGSITEGNTVTQETSGATGTVVAHDTTNKYILLRDSRGTFATGSATNHTVTDDTASGAVEMETADTATTEAVPVNAQAPFGTFAGGIWFFARAVTVDPGTINAADAQNFNSVTNEGVTVVPPNKQSLTITNLRDEDRVTAHRLTVAGGTVEKDTYTATVQSIGAATVVVSGSIAVDEPGKTAGGGTVVLVGDDEDAEMPIRYSSWSGSTFTLANQTSTATAGTSDTALVDNTGLDFTSVAKVGDIVVGGAAGVRGYSFITEITDADNCVMAGGTMSGFVSTDPFELNAVPIATTGADRYYVPLLYKYEDTGTDASTGSESSTITYDADIPVLVRVRNANSTASTTTPMNPYAAEVTFGSSGLSNAAIRSKDNIHS